MAFAVAERDAQVTGQESVELQRGKPLHRGGILGNAAVGDVLQDDGAPMEQTVATEQVRAITARQVINGVAVTVSRDCCEE